MTTIEVNEAVIAEGDDLRVAAQLIAGAGVLDDRLLEWAADTAVRLRAKVRAARERMEAEG